MSVVCAIWNGTSDWAIAADRMWSGRGEAVSYSRKLLAIPEFGIIGVAGQLGPCQLFARKVQGIDLGPDDRLFATWEEIIKHPVCVQSQGSIPNSGMYALYCGPSGLVSIDPYGGVERHSHVAGIGTGGLVAIGSARTSFLMGDESLKTICTRAVRVAIDVLPHECGVEPGLSSDLDIEVSDG